MNGLNEEREKLIQRIESVRAKLNRSIDEKEDYAPYISTVWSWMP